MELDHLNFIHDLNKIRETHLSEAEKIVNKFLKTKSKSTVSIVLFHIIHETKINSHPYSY